MSNQYKPHLEEMVASLPRLEAFRQFIVAHISEWDWEGESLLNDLLTDSTMTAEDLFEFLHSAKFSGEGNGYFRQAVSAMEACLRRAELSERKPFDDEEALAFSPSDAFLDEGFAANAMMAG